MAYLFLTIAILSEVTATSALKACAGFTRLGPSVLVLVGYCISFFMLSQVVKVIPLGYAYALWCGFGIILIAGVGFFYYRQPVDWPGVAGMALIMAGVLVINLFSKMAVR
ncbi:MULTISPECIES: multidrug efflux SMR transporter [unclassified Acidocella]|uniref:DMT family transporter n=1 Tax=unclassified Acidocella TaxID=2648610 RepID=UPI00028E70C6|nr:MULTISPECIES: multidrug efflux SMR transporter [unclassified Acidocella]EKN00465.1 SMR family multidrug resistance protein [Acidocella sp. MX-AZ02]WBO60007.1 multidrug efflux SMR transporter [Acidocella sp. MX-AZ03]